MSGRGYSLAPDDGSWSTVVMEMHTTSTPSRSGDGASTLGATASSLRLGGAFAAARASDGDRSVADVDLRSR